MEDLSVVLTSKDKTGATHISCELIKLIKPTIYYVATKIGVAQISDDKIVRLGVRILGKLEIYSANPIPVRLQSLHEMRANKTTRTTHQGCFHLGSLHLIQI